MGISNLTLYNNLRRKLGDQESHELVEFIHSEVDAEMETVKSDLEGKTNVFLTKEDKIDLIDRMDITKNDLIDRINATRNELLEKISNTRNELLEKINATRSELLEKISDTRNDLIDRMNKLETRLTIWIISAFILNYIMLMVTKKFF
jgi:hypothetical protein